MPNAICIGELLIDFVSTTTDVTLAECPGFTKAPGGAPANVAVGLAKLGVESGFIGKVGDEPFGDFLRGTLEGYHVDTSYLISGTGCRTTLAFVSTRSDGAKDIAFYRNPGADTLLTVDEIDETYIQSADLFHYGSVSLSHQPSRDATLKAIHAAKESDAFMSYDPNLRLMLWDTPEDARHWIWEVMPYANVVKAAEEEWEFITGTSELEGGSQRILGIGVDLVVVTRGEHGCYYNNGVDQGEVDGFPVEVVDPLGAGDGFVAAMLTQMMCTFGKVREPLLLDAHQLRSIMRYANAAGALTTQKIGVIPALPTPSEIEAFLKNSA
ncbi:MAG: PfkB family carbohydrate kinase [Candidatus Poribacteria bacterium]|nr:PfkB family carbohydrate kinase [Candidatus Poribacteria bacterium]